MSARRYAPHAGVGLAALLFVALPGPGAAVLQAFAGWFLSTFDLFALWASTACVLLCLVLPLTALGRRRIGGTDAIPEFRTTTWLAMLFAGGMGAGLVFWGPAEALIHAGSPPPGGAPPLSGEAVRDALAITQFHWALHGWAIYAVAALAVGLHARAGRAPLPSVPFVRLPSRARRALDWTALVAVLFGLVASLGQGVFQIGAGAGVVTDGAVPDGRAVQAALLGVLFVAYAASAAAGLRRGIAVLSVVNVILAVGLMVFVLLAGDTSAALGATWRSLTAYLAELPRLSFVLPPEGAARRWSRDWSLTYFLWWVAWSPFMGVFVARISRGRTVRAFIAGTVLVPSAATLIWFGFFGGAALSVQGAGSDLGVSDFATAPRAAYALLAELPLATLSQGLALLVVFSFLVTSADSGAYVLGLFGGDGAEPGVPHRLYWGAVLAAVTGAAVWSEGGQDVTRAMAVTGAVPLLFLLSAQGVVLVRDAWEEAQHAKGRRPVTDDAPSGLSDEVA